LVKSKKKKSNNLKKSFARLRLLRDVRGWDEEKEGAIEKHAKKSSGSNKAKARTTGRKTGRRRIKTKKKRRPEGNLDPRKKISQLLLRESRQD